MKKKLFAKLASLGVCAAVMFSAVGTNFITSAEENPDSQTEKVFPDKDDLKPVEDRKSVV